MVPSAESGSRSAVTFRSMSLRRVVRDFCDASTDVILASRRLSGAVGFSKFVPTIMERTAMAMRSTPSRARHAKTHHALPFPDRRHDLSVATSPCWQRLRRVLLGQQSCARRTGSCRRRQLTPPNSPLGALHAENARFRFGARWRAWPNDMMEASAARGFVVASKATRWVPDPSFIGPAPVKYQTWRSKHDR